MTEHTPYLTARVLSVTELDDETRRYTDAMFTALTISFDVS